MAKLKDGKTENITIRVTEDLRKRAEMLWKKDYMEIPFNSFLGYLVGKGADEEEYIACYRLKRAEMKEKGEADVLESVKFNTEVEFKRLERGLDLVKEAINKGKNLDQLHDEHIVTSGPVKKKAGNS